MEGYLGVIEALGFSFVPRNYGACAGALIAISQNNALFSLLGTEFGGDGRNTFGLPELRGRVPMGNGTGPGLPPYRIGQKVGFEEVTLVAANLPSHTHAHAYSGGGAGGDVTLKVSTTGGKKQVPATGDYLAPPGNALGLIQDNLFLTPSEVKSTVAVGGVTGGGGGFNSAGLSILNTGNSLPFPIVQPGTVVHYCICTQGNYPSRS